MYVLFKSQTPKARCQEFHLGPWHGWQYLLLLHYKEIRLSHQCWDLGTLMWDRHLDLYPSDMSHYTMKLKNTHTSSNMTQTFILLKKIIYLTFITEDLQAHNKTGKYKGNKLAKVFSKLPHIQSLSFLNDSRLDFKSSTLLAHIRSSTGPARW